MGVIYKITNTINNKVYIGQTYKTPSKRFKEHIRDANYGSTGCRALFNAIRKYKSENFIVEKIDEAEDDDKLDELEIKYIKEYNSLCPNGYNIQTGGKKGGKKHCAESRELMRQSKLGVNNHNYGKPRSEKTKKLISIAKSGEKHHFFGKQLSYEHKLALSKSHKNNDIPMYIAFLPSRPENYQASGYVVQNHPKLKKRKYFTSKKYTLEQKYKMALDYLEQLNNL